jgi:hypothetical protein
VPARDRILITWQEHELPEQNKTAKDKNANQYK